MPYRLTERGGKTCVVKKDSGETVPGGCHDGRDQAVAHLQALMANVEDSHRAAAEPEPQPERKRISDAFPLFPPAEWFEPPTDIQPGQRASLTTEGPDAGRFVAIVAPYKQCILGGNERSECWTAPESPTRYAAAHQGVTITAEGTPVDTANIGGGVNHANPRASMGEAVDHYSNVATQLLRVQYHDVPGVGIVACGAAWPGITDIDIAKVRASALSGDWRWRQELNAYDMAGSQLVTVPGFPRMPQVNAYAAGLNQPPAIIGGWGGPPEEAPMGDKISLDLEPAEVAVLTRVIEQARTAGLGDEKPCACKSHAAAPSDVPFAEGEIPEGGGSVSREEFDALVARVDQLESGQVQSDLTELDGMAASLALPEPVTAS